jgi:hypothetical protein
MDRRSRRWMPLVAGLAGYLGLVGCGSSSPAPTTHHAVKPAFAYPTTVTARPLGPRQGVVNVSRGTVVPSSELGMRVFVDAERGFALAELHSGETYPAATVDGGKRWRIDGPVFHIPAANGAAEVALAGAAPPRTYFAFGGGSVVDLSTDGGRHWWVAVLGEDVIGVLPGPGPKRLVAAVQNESSNGSKVATVVYGSTDGGRHWHRTDRFAY